MESRQSDGPVYVFDRGVGIRMSLFRVLRCFFVCFRFVFVFS